ncbi:MAG: tryptophan--tRNA ligase [Candidatus Parvarchaeota archaeon]|nr:tryptophan--tRNA ligase [Candidatus Rehaiarchaeum fermentans]
MKAINPFEVSGEISEDIYIKLVKDFGLKIIDTNLLAKIKQHTKELHPLIEYGIFFAHRDLDLILSEYENGKPFYLYTGRGPSGEMHLGHLIPFYFTKWLQEKFNVYLLIQITDDEKFLTKNLTEDQVSFYAKQNMLDILSLGFIKGKTFFILDSRNAKILYNLAIKFSKHVTFSQVRSTFGMNESDNIGKIFFPSIQAVPSFILSYLLNKPVNCLIPYAIDQDDYFRLTRDVLPKLGYPKPASIVSKFLPSLIGEGKMSSSKKDTSIYLNDSEAEVRKKIFSAFSGGRDTKEEQIKYGADLSKDVPFQIYRILEEDRDKVEKVKEEYSSGKMLSGEMKEITYRKVIQFLDELKERREKIKDEIEEYMFDEEKIKKMLLI